MTSNNAAANVSTLPTATKAQTAKEVIAENVRLLIEQLEAGHSKGLTAYLTAMAGFTTTASGTFSRSHGRSPTQRGLPVAMRGTSWAAR